MDLKIVELRRQGKSYKEISKLLDITSSQINNAIRRVKIGDIRKPERIIPKLTDPVLIRLRDKLRKEFDNAWKSDNRFSFSGTFETPGNVRPTKSGNYRLEQFPFN